MTFHNFCIVCATNKSTIIADFKLHAEIESERGRVICAIDRCTMLNNCTAQRYTDTYKENKRTNSNSRELP